MIFRKLTWDFVIDFDEPFVLLLSYKNDLFEFINKLLNQINYDDYNFILNDDIKEINIDFSKKVELISNPYILDFSSKKITNFLYKEIISVVFDSDLIINLNKLIENTYGFVEDIKKYTLINFDYEKDLSIDKFLKILNVKYKINYNNSIELLNKYIDILYHSCKIQIIFICFAFQLYDEDEIIELIKYCKMNNIYLIFLENKKNILFEKIGVIVYNVINDMLF